MFGYPLFLNLQGRPCLVFGGGKVAYRKVQALLKRGARVTCVSQDFCAPLRKLAAATPLTPTLSQRERGKRGTPFSRGGKTNISLAPRRREERRKARGAWLELKRFTGGRISLNGARLVIAATSDRPFNLRVAQLCRQKKILVNVVDDPELCDFYAPAVVERGPLQIAISTGGTSPLFAKRMRELLEKAVPRSTGRVLEKIGRMRRRLLSLRNGMKGNPITKSS